MVKISKFGRDFLLLALRIGKHVNGYVDFYIGPENLKLLVENESITSPNKLLDDCNTLQKNLFLQRFDKDREMYLEKHLIAMEALLEDLLGNEIPFKEKFLRLYDVELQSINETELSDLINHFNEAYIGNGSLDERMKKYREDRKVPEEKVYTYFNEALNLTKFRFKELFGDILPAGENISIELIEEVNDNQAKWTCYEWYLGNYKSRLELNPRYSQYWTALIFTAAHEGYPGHHTNFVLNEYYLYHELNQFEHSVLLLKSPKLVICEGISDLAVNVLFSYKKQAELSLRFCINPTDDDSTDKLVRQYKTKANQSLFLYNLAYHALCDKWSEEELIQYAEYYEIFTIENIKNMLKIISNPAHSTTAFLYNLGSKLMMKKYGEFPSVANFKNLLLNPFLPSDIT